MDAANTQAPAGPGPSTAGKPAGPAPAEPASDGMLRFTLVTGAWFVGLFGLMRLPWVERTLLTPFAQLQQGVADQLTGAPSNLVYADASCSGGDPIALCAGAILAYPATWGARLRGAAVGIVAITALNVVRLGNLSLVAEDQALLNLLHVYVWPGILILAAAGFVYAWMGRQGSAADGGPGGGAAAGALSGGVVLGPAARRFLLLAALLVVAYFATAPFFYQSPAVDVIAGWIARGRRDHPGRGRHGGEGAGGVHLHLARRLRRHPGVHLHPAHPVVPGRRARRAPRLEAPGGDAPGDAGRLLRPRRLAPAGAGRPGRGRRVVRDGHTRLLADARRRPAGRRGGNLHGGRRAAGPGAGVPGDRGGRGGCVRGGAGARRGRGRRGLGPAGPCRPCRPRLRRRPGRVGDPAGLPGRPVRRAVDRRGRRRPVVAPRPARARRGGPGARGAGRAGGRARPPLRLRPARRPDPRLGSRPARRRGLAARPPGPHRGHRRVARFRRVRCRSRVETGEMG